MGLLRKLTTLFGAPALPDPASLAVEEEIKAHFRQRCARFRRLLSANKEALEAMADVEQRLASPQPFGMRYVKSAMTRTGSNVFQMIRSLNELSDNAWPELMDSFQRIVQDMEKALQSTPPPDDGPLVLPIHTVTLKDKALVGGKMASLGEISHSVGLQVPDGFAVTTHAYYHFMRASNLQEEIDSRIQAANIAELDPLFTLSASIQQLIQKAPMPADLAEAITEQVQALLHRTPPEQRADLRLALRSSAVGEDALGASFAGQYHSELNVHPDETLEVWREIIASKYAVTAMSYRYQRGIPDHMVPMCVGILAMVRAKAGGVAYSRDPMRPHTQVINAVPGLPKAVVDGSFSPDTLLLSRQRPVRVLERHVVSKPFYYVSNQDLGVRRVALEGAAALAPSIDDSLACRLGEIALTLEEFYGLPQDVEWAVNNEDSIIILQSRPLKDIATDEERDEGKTKKAAPLPEDNAANSNPAQAPLPPPLCAGGACVSPGVGMGPVCILRKDADILKFPQGGVLVVQRAGPRWAPLLSRASAVLAQEGGTAGHLASVAREYGLPAIFGVPDCIKTLEQVEQQIVTVDAVRGHIYVGEHPHILGAKPHKNLMQGSPVHQMLFAVSRFMVPLHLLDPAAADFAPAHCRSLHDITRFCHEKSVNLMFGAPDAADFEQAHGKQLKAGVKLKYWIIDIDDGFTEPVTGPVVDINNIRSAPMLALWKGMTAIPWTGPPATNAAGFLSVVAESSMNKDLESTAHNALANHNFLMISSTFMNLQARFGYHFCTVESQAGDKSYENYVSFQFKGGAASLDRRILRARMVGALLEDFGFQVDVKEDALFATAEGYDKKASLARTLLLGYVIIHTRQADMIMQHQAQAQALRQKLLHDMHSLMEQSS